MKDSYVFYKEKLSGEYKAVFEQVELYVLSQNVDEFTCEERLGGLLDIFLSAEAAGKPVEKITGSNLERFCKTFCSDLGVKHRILGIMDLLKTMAWLLMVFTAFDLLIFFLDASDTGDYNILHSVSSLNAAGFLVGVLIFGLFTGTVYYFLRKFMFRRRWVSMKVLNTVPVLLAIVGFGILYWALSAENGHTLTCPSWVILGLSGVYLVLYYLFRGRHIRRDKVKFSDLLQTEYERSFADTMEKKLVKARKKSLKRGKELTVEAFLAREEKTCRLSEKLMVWYYITPVFLTALAYFGTWLHEGFETFFDAAFFIVIMLAVEYPIMLVFGRLERKANAARREWIRAKRDTLPQGEKNTAEDDNK